MVEKVMYASEIASASTKSNRFYPCLKRAKIYTQAITHQLTGWTCNCCPLDKNQPSNSCT